MEILLENQKVVKRRKDRMNGHNAFYNYSRHFKKFRQFPLMKFPPLSLPGGSPKSLLPLWLITPLLILTAAILPSREPGYWKLESAVEGLSLPSDTVEEAYFFDETGETYDGTGGAADPSALIEVPTDAVLQSVESIEYTVKPNDVLSKIAYQNNLALGTLISFNKIRNADKLKEGDVIKIPNMDGVLYKVSWGDNLSKIADEYGISVNAILDANALETDKLKLGMELFLPRASMNSFDLKRALNQLFLTPARGILTSPFGFRKDPFTGIRKFHNGLDIAAPLGTPVKVALDGLVVNVGYHSSYGNYIIVNHQKGYQTLYAHLQKSLVRKGQRVTQGDKIGLMGSTGYSTGSHLHFCVFENKKPVDPQKFLKL